MPQYTVPRLLGVEGCDEAMEQRHILLHCLQQYVFVIVWVGYNVQKAFTTLPQLTESSIFNYLILKVRTCMNC